MLTPALKTVSDNASLAHARIQQEFPNINPVVGVNHGMRASGFPADVMTIDCLTSGKRIILILHDDTPELVRYQFSYRDKDPADEFESMALGDVTEQCLFNWIKMYFSSEN